MFFVIIIPLTNGYLGALCWAGYAWRTNLDSFDVSARMQSRNQRFRGPVMEMNLKKQMQNNVTSTPYLIILLQYYSYFLNVVLTDYIKPVYNSMFVLSSTVNRNDPLHVVLSS